MLDNVDATMARLPYALGGTIAVTPLSLADAVQGKYRCARKKHTLGKFDSKVFFEVWNTASYLIFREESEFKVKNPPKP